MNAITIDDLNDLYYSTSSLFERIQSGDYESLRDAIDMQSSLDLTLSRFKTENPDTLIFIDVINKSIKVIDTD